jgi:hypothetical protein
VNLVNLFPIVSLYFSIFLYKKTPEKVHKVHCPPWNPHSRPIHGKEKVHQRFTGRFTKGSPAQPPREGGWVKGTSRTAPYAGAKSPGKGVGSIVRFY